jgi:hypothetical protein
MAKWSGLLISAVAYDSQHRVTFVKQHKDTGDNIDKGVIVDRATLASNIKNGISCVTIYNTLSNWKLGDKLRTFRIGSEFFIRCDDNKVTSDHLGALPELSISETGEEISKPPSLEEKKKPTPQIPPKSPPKPAPEPAKAPEPKPAPEPAKAPEPKPTPTPESTISNLRGSLPKPESISEYTPETETREITDEQFEKLEELEKHLQEFEIIQLEQLEQIEKLGTQIQDLHEKKSTAKPEPPKTPESKVESPIESTRGSLPKPESISTPKPEHVEEATPEQLAQVEELERQIEKLEKAQESKKSSPEIKSTLPKSKEGLDGQIEQLRELSNQIDELEQAVEKSEKSKKEPTKSSPTQGSQVEAYCIKCKSKRVIKNPFETTLKNGRSAIKGVCIECGTNVCRMGKISK